MNIYLLRHAIAEERSRAIWPDDASRPLTTKGKHRMKEAARGMRALSLSFDVIYTSPLVRARQTAEIVAMVFHCKRKLRETETLATDGDPEELVSLIRSSDDDVENILLVGHEPYMSTLISTLLLGNTGLPVTMKKAGLCKLRVGTLKYGPCASLEWLLPPSIIRTLARHKA